MAYEHLERHQPTGVATLQLTMAFTRLAVGDPAMTEEVGRAAELKHWPITGVAALPEVLLLQVEVEITDDLSVEMAMLGAQIVYSMALSKAMFREAAMSSAETFITCKFVKARWKGTAHWEFDQHPETEETRGLPLRALN